MGKVTFNRCTVKGQTISPSVKQPQWQESKITYQTKSNICGTAINRGTSGKCKVSRICLDRSVSDAFVWNIEFQTKQCMLQCSKPAPRARLFCFILDLIPSVKQCFFYFLCRLSMWVWLTFFKTGSSWLLVFAFCSKVFSFFSWC